MRCTPGTVSGSPSTASPSPLRPHVVERAGQSPYGIVPRSGLEGITFSAPPSLSCLAAWGRPPTTAIPCCRVDQQGQPCGHRAGDCLPGPDNQLLALRADLPAPLSKARDWGRVNIRVESKNQASNDIRPEQAGKRRELHLSDQHKWTAAIGVGTKMTWASVTTVSASASRPSSEN